MSLELRLLLACARVKTTKAEEGAIRQLLEEGVDWTDFAQKALAHGLAGLAGHSLARVAPDLVPEDILEALCVIVEQTRRKNRALFEELARIMEVLAKDGVEAIPFKGPVLAIQAYGDPGLRVFRDLDLLIHDRDLAATIATLRRFGYERSGELTTAQFELIHHLQGQEIIFKRAGGIAVEPHTRLTSSKMALDIDYAGLWRRAQRSTLQDRTMLTLAPEDDLLILAIHGGKELWWNIKWACDVAAFIGSHPALDWSAIVARAREQGCLRMVLLATALARRYFNAAVPDAIVAAERNDPAIEPMVGHVMVHWQSDEPGGPASNMLLSRDRLRLHDGLLRQARYVARTLFLPAPHHVAMLPLPRALSFAYMPIKIAHDAVALPSWRVYRQLRAQFGRLQNALAGSDLALVIMPATAQSKQAIKRHLKSCADARRVLAKDPNDPTAWDNLGDASSGLKRYEQAIACYDKALAIVPNNRNIWKKRGATLRTIGRPATLPEFLLDPQNANAWAMRAGFFHASKSHAEAVEASDRALSIDPGNLAAVSIGIHCRLQSCDWRQREDDKRRIAEGLRADRCVLVSSDQLSISDSEADNRIAAQFVARESPPSATPLWRGERYRHDKIRIAYVSADLHAHATGFLIAGVFENHDRTRFETTAVSLGASDGTEMRGRIESAFDRFMDAQSMTDLEVATKLRELEIDIAIDLKGYTAFRRTGIFAHRPAPVQVNYLGYPGTMDLPYIDYIIADKVVIPAEHQIHYREKVVYLPHSYQPNDSKRPKTGAVPSRGEAGLPETGFVFACLNNTYKIGPEMFDIWMRLLSSVKGSVLWLLEDNTSASLNLRREAKARGIDSQRLIFAPRKPPDEHLVRQRLADLFLDTLPYNAHTTASDALWAGLPVLTCPGHTFPARVAASLLYAIGLPELVTSSLAEYEELARALAHDPERLSAIKAKLMRNRDSEPLFDTPRFTRYLEAAYTTMWQRQQAGSPPASFAVPS